MDGSNTFRVLYDQYLNATNSRGWSGGIGLCSNNLILLQGHIDFSQLLIQAKARNVGRIASIGVQYVPATHSAASKKIPSLLVYLTVLTCIMMKFLT